MQIYYGEETMTCLPDKKYPHMATSVLDYLSSVSKLKGAIHAEKEKSDARD